MSRYVKDASGDWHLTSGMDQIDPSLSDSSTHPVQNKAINEAINTRVYTAVIDSLSQLPNNDLALLDDGCYFVRSSMIENPDALNMPPITGGAIITIMTLPANMAKIYECSPFIEWYSSYRGQCWAAESTPKILWSLAMPFMSNNNIIDNPWFTINQRGQTTYTAPGDYHCLDRWRILDGTSVSITDNGISYTNTNDHFQNLHQLKEIDCVVLGRVHTMSIMLSDGTLLNGRVTLPNEVPSSWAQYVAYSDANINFGIYLITGTIQFYIGIKGGTTLNIRAMKFERGTDCTLRYDTPPDKATELIKCQRYFQRIGKTGSTANGKAISVAPAWSTSDIWFPITLAAPMRANPYTDKVVGEFYVTNMSAGERVAVRTSLTTINFGDTDPVSSINVAVYKEGEAPFTKGTVYKLSTPVVEAPSYFDILAEI